MLLIIIIAELITLTLLGVVWFTISPRTSKNIGVFLLVGFTGWLIWACYIEKLPNVWQGIQALCLIILTIYCLYAFSKRQTNILYTRNVFAVIVAAVLLVSSTVSACIPYFVSDAKTRVWHGKLEFDVEKQEFGTDSQEEVDVEEEEVDVRDKMQVYIDFNLTKLKHSEMRFEVNPADTTLGKLLFEANQKNEVYGLDTRPGTLYVSTNYSGDNSLESSLRKWKSTKLNEFYEETKKGVEAPRKLKPGQPMMQTLFLSIEYSNPNTIISKNAGENDKYELNFNGTNVDIPDVGKPSLMKLETLLGDSDDALEIKVRGKKIGQGQWTSIDGDWRNLTLMELVNTYLPATPQKVINDHTAWLWKVQLRTS